ncbi:TIGR02611 family protein [Candidatus Saccharibacteria bacterium]|nr:MAG: TIGR02611 family protein [Candidatus Saccharibacteria bacterium]
MRKLPNSTRKILIGFSGWAVLLVGVIMIPYPGPGWVVVFIGLSILATEFEWASDAHNYVHTKYDAWQKWLVSQPFFIKALFWCLTALTVVVTVWLLNGYGLLASWAGLNLPWLNSPLVR